jgi:hypothetical protein
VIKCSVCGYDNQDGAQFCLNCGSPLEQQKISEAMDDISGEATVVIDPKALRLPPPQPKPAAAAPPPPPPPPAAAPAPRPAASAPPPPPPQPAAQPRPAAPPPAPAPQQQQYGAPQAASGSKGGLFDQGTGILENFLGGSTPNATMYLIVSIASICVCCCIGGIGSTYFSWQGKVAQDSGDFDTANTHFAQARKWLLVTIVVGIISFLLSMVLQVLGAVLSAAS